MTAQVVIVGGGFGGLYAARALARAPVAVTLVDRTNHHLFQPLLYQVATAGLAMPDIAAPIRHVLRAQANATVLLGEVAGVDLAGRRVRLAGGAPGAPGAPGAELRYDALILAPGAITHYFGHDDWAAHAPGLKDGADALAIRSRILLAYEAAERQRDERARAPLLTFVVIGGGPTGVELAGVLADIARHTLSRNFRNFDAADSRIVLIEAGPRLLPAMPPELSADAERRLTRMGVTVRTGCRVTAVDKSGVTLVGASTAGVGGTAGSAERLDAATVLWAAGVAASPLTRMLGAPVDRAGRVLVNDDLSLPGHPEVFVIGDAAAVRDGAADATAAAGAARATAGATVTPHWVPGVAPAAIQMGRHAAHNVELLLGRAQTQPFRYRDQGDLATIGRTAAVARLGRLRFSGWPAWLLWVAVHVAQLIGFRNRLLVLFEWAWLYVTQQRGARVVVTEPQPGGSDVTRDTPAPRM